MRKKFLLPFTLLLAGLFILTHANTAFSANNWLKTYGGSEEDTAIFIQQTTDGGYVMAGYTESSGAGGYDAWILKLSTDGTIDWQKTYGGSESDGAYSIQQTTDGGYIVAGYTESSGAGGYDAWILKLSTDGSIDWQKTYGGSESDGAYSIQQTTDGGYIVAGYTYSSGAGHYDAWILKLNSNGSIDWQKTYGDIGSARSIQQTIDGGYIIISWHDVLKLNTDGSIDWQKTYGNGSDYVFSIQQTTDGGYIMAGYTYYTDSSGADQLDAWILKLNPNGSIDWQKTYGRSDSDIARSIQQTTDGGYIVAGYTWYDAWILKLDSNGDIGVSCDLVDSTNIIPSDTNISGINTSVTPVDTTVLDVNSSSTVEDTYVTDYTNCAGYTESTPKSWIRTYGGDNHDYAFSSQQTTDGGYIVAGSTYSSGIGESDAWILKLNSNGSIDWQKTYGGSDSDIARSIQQTTDGGYIVAGYTESSGAGNNDAWILKLNSNANIDWQKTYGGSEYDATIYIQQTTDGGFIVAGYTESSGAGEGDAWILKLNSDGSIDWQNTYGGSDSDYAYSIQQTTDGGYIVAGYTYSSGAGERDAWILKLNSNGSIDWQKTYGGSGFDYARSIQQTTDGGYIVAGNTYSSGAGQGDAWILKLNSDGSIDWQNTYGGSDSDYAYSIQQTTDGGYIVASYTYISGAADWDAWILKLGTDGSIEWQKTYGGDDDDNAYSIQQTTDGGYIVAGYTKSSGAGGYDAWILKLDSIGDIGVSCDLIDSTNVIPSVTTASGINTSVTPVNTSVSDVAGTLTKIDSFLITDNPECIGYSEETAPIVAIDFPSCGTVLTNAFGIFGYAYDEDSGVFKVEVQITDGTWYVGENQNITQTPTWIEAEGTDFWYVFTDSINFTDGVEYTVYARATDYALNQSTETCTFIFSEFESDTTMSINLSAQRILYDDTLDVSGKLTPLPDRGQDMEGLKITIDVMSPSGATASYTTTTNEFGQYTITGISDFDEEGPWTLQARFDGFEDLYRESESEAVTLLVGESAGYAIIIQGKIESNEGLDSHNKTTNRIYDKFIERNFEDDDIYYFNYDTLQTGVDVDEFPTITRIQYAIETWAKDKITAVPAPLYIIMVNHGDIEAFHIDDELITPSDLGSWLSNLESALEAIKPEALEKKRIIILGYCYSGSFIQALSKEGRIVITSAAEDEESYKGPDEPDGIRSGEFFIEELFKELGRGYSLKESFQTATERTEDYTQQNTGTSNTSNPYFDNSVQHPLLDDDGDSVGTNEITAGSEDGKESANIIFGSGETYTNTGINPADITDLTETIYLGADETSASMWATVNDDDRVDAIWIEVRSPAMTISTIGSGESEQLELDLPNTFLEYNTSTKRYEANYTEFDNSGKWEIYYFVKDTQTSEISPMMRSTVYKDKAGNNPPGEFDLISPADGNEQQTMLSFEWEASSDPDGDNITYNLLIATDEDFNDIVYKKEEITTTAAIVDIDAGLSDLTKYYWKVQAVDIYGAVTDSNETWSFYTDNTNFGFGYITGIVYDSKSFAPLIGGTVKTDFGDEDTTKTEGYYIMSANEGTYTVTCSFDGYSDTSFSEISVSDGKTTELNIPMTSSVIITGPAPDIKANGSDNTVTIGAGDSLSITVSLFAGDSLGVDCDWWLAESTPDGWYYLDAATMSWLYAGGSYTELFPTYQEALFDLVPYNILNTSELSEGTYTYYFAIDTNMDGILDLDQIYYDSVIVNVQ